MRVVPRSLYGRLLALSMLATLAALAFAALAIGGILERFVTAGLDDRLDAELSILASAVNRDGTIDTHRAVIAAPYDDPASGWGWRIDAPHGRRTSAAPPAIGPERTRGPLPLPHEAGLRHGSMPPLPGADKGEPRPFDWRDGDGRRRHARRLFVATAAGPATIVAAAPHAIVERPIRAAMAPLLGSLAALGLALALASLVQLRLGLRPLTRLRGAVAAIRAGKAERLPDDQPHELAPLASELNALVAQNAARLAQARGHVANLAHGLKTPLATLALGLRETAPDAPALENEVARMERAIRHHLGRARADAGGVAARVAVPLAPVVAALAAALTRIHADRGIAFTADVPTGLALPVDPQDLDELLGNLLDNGWRWARTRLTLTATRDAALVRIAIVDDGPGIPPAARAEAVAPGRRLDEAGDGHGFGLSIARELIELYDGTLMLDASDSGGLTVRITFPGVADG